MGVMCTTLENELGHHLFFSPRWIRFAFSFCSGGNAAGDIFGAACGVLWNLGKRIASRRSTNK
jgi:hypothetical protein